MRPKNKRRLSLAEWWAWLEAELAQETARKQNAWEKRDLDNVKTLANNCPEAPLEDNRLYEL